MSRTLALVVGTTETASIEGISAAGADPDLLVHTPPADAELLAYGTTVWAPGVPTSPTGCPTPALVTRAARELAGFEAVAVDGGLAAPTGAPTVDLGAAPGGDVRDLEPVPDAREVFESARAVGESLPGEAWIAESVPGGTTTALGVLRALGEPHGVSSSLPENPLDRKREAVEAGLAASGLAAGDLAGRPIEAVRRMGDPVLAGVAGLAAGRGRVRLAGGTQMVAAAALLRHAGIEAPIEVATTPFVAEDDAADLPAAAAALDLAVTVTDPGFGDGHAALDRYRAGEAKEGAGMGGALAIADRAGVDMADVRERAAAIYEREVADGP